MTSELRTVSDFEAAFGTEEQCIAALRRSRWPQGFRCPKCKGERAWKMKTRPLDECAKCGRQVSLIAGTLFQGTRKPLRTWFRVMAHLVTSKSGCSALEVSRLFGLHYETAWTWLHKMRRLMDRQTGRPLNGWLEADECYVGGRKAGVDGRQPSNKALVLGAVEQQGRASGRLRLAIAASASAACISTFFQRSIAPGSHVRTDGWSGYRPLAKLGYDHAPIRLFVGHNVESERNAARHLPRIHRVFSLFKRVLLGTHHGAPRKRHLQAYADEFTFRFNRRTSGSRFLLFSRLLGASVFRAPPTKRHLFYGDTPLIGGA